MFWGPSQAIEPPPAPTVTMSTMGVFTGKRSIRLSVVNCGRRSSIRLTSVEVPPASSVRMLRYPARSPMKIAASTPAAGPDSSVVTGRSAARRAVTTPPFDCMIRKVVRPEPASSWRSASTR